MDASTKLMLAGVGVQIFARASADVRRAAALREPDDFERARHLETAQAYSTMAVAGEGLLWFGLWKAYPTATVVFGSALVALHYAPSALKKLGAYVAPSTYAPPPMSAWQGVY